ncbi:MAG: N-6 DNA methylase [bacterium]|nr:N-6 DNA methylase [bacterium]
MAKKQKVEKEIKLEDILFNCRDLLRGKASMADKRDLLLTLVFLRFIGEKFTLKRREVAQRLITVDGVAEDSTEYGFFLNQSSFYDDCFYLTEEVRWETIKDMPASVDLALNLDNIISALERDEKTLRGALPQKIFTKAQLEPKVLKSVIDEVNKISQERFHEKDLIGRVYEYFLQAFALNAEKEEGEFYTPHSIVELIASLIEPFDGTIYDPCCGSGGMFVQSVKFVEAHGGNTNAVNVYGQERDPDTYRLAKMNLAVRGISHNLGDRPASTFQNPHHGDKKMDYIMANPPFNLKKWRAVDELTNDARWDGYGLPPVSNANYAWILHMLSKLEVTHGIAGFLLANGALSDDDSVDIRQKLIENDKVEAIIVLPRNMFYSTDISVTLWILNQNKKGGLWHGRQQRSREGEILFMDLRTWNENIYEKKYVQFVPEQIEKVVDIYHRWQAAGTDGTNFAEPELYRSVGIEEIKDNGWSLVPSRYIEFVDRDTNIDYESVMSEASKKVASLLARQEANDAALRKAFAALGFNLETKNKIKNYGNQ